MAGWGEGGYHCRIEWYRMDGDGREGKWEKDGERGGGEKKQYVRSGWQVAVEMTTGEKKGKRE